MNERGCPPDYNGGFCADYDVDCKACWEQWEQEHKAEGRCVMDECKVCANADNEYCFACDNGNKFKPVTNYDLLMSKSPEQLAHTLWLTANGGIIGQRSEDEWLDWLKRETKEK